MKIISSSTHQCPECLRSKTCTPEQILFVVSGKANIIRCAACGWILDEVRDHLPEEVEIPVSLERLIEVLVFKHGFGICEADNDAFAAVNESAISRAASLNFEHRELLIVGTMTWYEVPQLRSFRAHNADFAGIQKYAPIPAVLVREFNDEQFLVSEGPGSEGRGLRNAGIRYCRYLEASIPAQAPSRLDWIAERQTTQSRAGKSENSVLYVRSYLTWDVGYRRLPDGTVEKVAS